jgi:hypothetical protein
VVSQIGGDFVGDGDGNGDFIDNHELDRLLSNSSDNAELSKDAEVGWTFCPKQLNLTGGIGRKDPL